MIVKSHWVTGFSHWSPQVHVFRAHLLLVEELAVNRGVVGLDGLLSVDLPLSLVDPSAEARAGLQVSLQLRQETVQVIQPEKQRRHEQIRAAIEA